MVVRMWWYEREDKSQLQRSKLGERSDLPGLSVAAARCSARVLREGATDPSRRRVLSRGTYLHINEPVRDSGRRFRYTCRFIAKILIGLH